MGMGHQMLPIAFFPDRPRCHGNEIWNKTGYSSICVKDFCDIFAPIGWFWGWAIKCCQSHFPPTDPRCHGNKIWDKIDYNLACVKDICKIFLPIGFFWDALSNAANRIFPHRPFCHGNEIGDKIGYNSACVTDICEIFCICGGVFGNGPSNAAN